MPGGLHDQVEAGIGVCYVLLNFADLTLFIYVYMIFYVVDFQLAARCELHNLSIGRGLKSQRSGDMQLIRWPVSR